MVRAGQFEFEGHAVAAVGGGLRQSAERSASTPRVELGRSL
jgi:hypothetical protein